jgi:hypothetical protein
MMKEISKRDQGYHGEWCAGRYCVKNPEFKPIEVSGFDLLYEL